MNSLAGSNRFEARPAVSSNGNGRWSSPICTQWETDAGIGFTLTAGGTAFAAGDKFTLTVEDAVGTYKLSVKTAVDGSQTPVTILADYADASAGPVTTGAYLMAEVNANALNFDPSWDIPTLTAALRPYSIFVKSSVSAADPS